MTDNLAHQFLLDPDVVFLNHGSYGACPKPVFQAYQAWQLQLERHPVAFLDPKRGLSAAMQAARTALAAELGTHSDNIVAQVNATQALNVVAQSLNLQPGGAKVVTPTVPLPLMSADSFTAALVAGITPPLW